MFLATNFGDGTVVIVASTFVDERLLNFSNTFPLQDPTPEMLLGTDSVRNLAPILTASGLFLGAKIGLSGVLADPVCFIIQGIDVEE